MTDRQKWEHATEQSRHLAIAADAELRRRHPDQKIDSLRSAERDSVSGNEPEWLHSVLQGNLAVPAARIGDLVAQHQAFRTRMNERQRLMMPIEDLNWPEFGETSLSLWPPGRNAILQPPRPQITSSATLLEFAAEHDPEPEAAD